MGLRSWLFGKEDKPPEPLVLGAELSCPYGAENSYLIVQTKDINISNLPGACVLDRKEYENIMPFGQCIMGAPCATVMELEKQWENEEPQKTLANGEEIITTKSTLMCKTFGVAIEAVTSGQDGVEAARMAEEFAFLQNMEEKYPGLFEVLRNPWGSVYLTEDMYKLALQFLEDYVEKNGEMQIQVLYSEPSLQTDMVKAAIGHLLAFCNEENEGDLINLLYVRGSTSGMYEVPGWQPDLLNEAMIELLRKDCEDTAERIETNAYYRWQEKNKQHIRWYAEKGMELAYASLILWDMTAEQTRASRQMEEVKKYAEKVKEVEKEAGQVEGGTPTGTVWDNIKATQDNYPNTNVPKSFEVEVNGQKMWVHGNATEHMYEDVYAKITAGEGTAYTNPNLYTQELMSDFYGSLEQATVSGIQYGELISAGNWEFIFAAPRQEGLLPVIKHAQFNGW